MTTRSFAAAAATLLALAGAMTTIQAEEVGQHPAVFASRTLPAVNPSTFIVGHPASPSLQRRHANADHPAVQLAHRDHAVAIDPNLYLVQPPATTAWLLKSTPVEGAVALARPAGRASTLN